MTQCANREEVSDPPHQAYAGLLCNGLDGAGKGPRILVNEAARIERTQNLQALPYELSAQRGDQDTGYKSRTLLTRMGQINFEVSQVRSTGFYPSALERSSRSEQSVNLALGEIYVQGVSTGKVIEVLRRLIGLEVNISWTQICRCTEKLDVEMETWRNLPLDETPYVLLDDRYEHIRDASQVVDCAVLVTVGVTARSHRRVLGVSVALSEAEVLWHRILDNLIKRGPGGFKFIVSDDHAGLMVARKAMFAGVPWQRCQFHLQPNTQGYAFKPDQRVPVARTISSRISAPDANEASRLLALALHGRQREHPKLAAVAEKSLPEGFTVSNSPPENLVRMCTTNGVERLNREFKRRTRVTTLFPDSTSCLRLVITILAEQDEECCPMERLRQIRQHTRIDVSRLAGTQRALRQTQAGNDQSATGRVGDHRTPGSFRGPAGPVGGKETQPLLCPWRSRISKRPRRHVTTIGYQQ